MIKNIAIIDDEVEVLENIEKIIHKYNQNIRVYKYIKSESFLCTIKNIEYDAIILDVFLDSINGIDLANKLENLKLRAPIIFISGKPRESFDVYDAKHFYFIEKPFNEKIFHKALQKIDTMLDEHYIQISYNKITISLCSLDIIYVESEKRKLKIVLKNKIIPTYSKLDDFEKSLGDGFLRVSQSFLVNKKMITSISNNEVTLNNGLKLGISKKYKDFVLEWKKNNDIC